MHVRQKICVFMLFIYLGHFLVFSYSLITYACSIIAVYRHRATLLNLIYLGFCTLINTSFVYLAKFAVHWQIHFILIIICYYCSCFFFLASTAALNSEMNKIFDGRSL